MKIHRVFAVVATAAAAAVFPLQAGQQFACDTIATTAGPLVITFIGHGTLMMQHGGRTIHIDPVGGMADYTGLPKGDLVLVTHHHGDHFDTGALQQIVTGRTEVYLTKTCAAEYPAGVVLANGDKRVSGEIVIEAVPAYNLVHKRPDGKPFHPKGEGNGYVLTFGRSRVYIAGDTENTPEMKGLKEIAVAFLPMNLPYTMTPAMVADAAGAFKPKILYPYHYGKTDPRELVKLLQGIREIEIRIREMQ
jgi:L-ascorbate metabolism protein UlaG (beta-lactamase superfamily)